jgi:nucleotide-binding universal stress UspA family protein
MAPRVRARWDGTMIAPAPAPAPVAADPSPTVLCGVDASPGALAAARVAARLARDLGGRLLLVHVCAPIPHVTPPGSPGLSDEMAAAYRDERRGRALDLLDAMADAVACPGAGRRAPEGDVAEVLAEEARDAGAALLVVGSQGRGAVMSAVLGSVSGALVRSAPCPVVVVPPAAAAGQPAGVWGVAAERSQPAAAVPARHAAS